MSVPAHLPSPLAEITKACTWHQILLGQSGATVYRLTRPDQTQLYLKTGPSAPNHSLLDEKERLVWLHARLPVPHVELFVQDDQLDYLLMAEMPGIDTSDKVYSSDLPTMVRLLGEGMRLFHSVPIVDCPFDETLNIKMARARQRAASGLLPLELLAELEATRPQTEDLVLTHGDYCLPNILLHNGQLSGFIDLGRAGVADRYQDIALAVRSLAYNFGEGWAPQLFAAYGIEPDEAKLAFYTQLDDCF
ncbi:MAG: aminoglycoside 3'-phosphotransferase [Chloroflexi bacterium]|nr:aminoglycoside 3'-phosphotransferase [Chloroflexota bacterium]